MSYSNREAGLIGIFGASFVAMLLFLGGSAIIGAFLFPYVINSWLAFFGKLAVVTWWQGAIIGIIPGVGQTSIPLALATFILMLILV